MDPLFDFTGKVVLVTGGSRGLGREMVLAFAERGADVVIASRKLQACEEVGEIDVRGGRAVGPVELHRRAQRPARDARGGLVRVVEEEQVRRR